MKRSYILLSVMCLMTSVVSAEDISEERDSLKSYNAGEVVVQSFKANEDLYRQPVSASVVSGAVLRERNVESVKELSAFIPNMFMPDYGSKMTSPIYIRGIGSRTNTPSVGLYVDGVPYFDRSAFDFDINDIERIEVLRGPQGTIYGRNTMGGIINVYTRSPFSNPGTNISLGTGNYNQYRAAASHSGSVAGRFGYSAAGNYLSSGGYIKNITTGKMSNPMDAASGRIRLSWQAAPKLLISLSSVYEYSDQDGYPYALYDNATNTVGQVDYNATSFYRRSMSTTGLNVEYIMGRMLLSSQSSFQYFDGRQGLDQDFSPKDTYYVDYTEFQRMYSQEFNLKSVGPSRYQSQSGVFGFYQSYEYVSDVNARDPAVAAASYERRTTRVGNPTKGLALYHQSKFNDLVFNGLSLSAGIRYDLERTDAESAANQVAVNGSEINEYAAGNDTFSQFTPKASLQYDFANDDMAYFTVARGYKSGGFNASAQLAEDFTFDPEYSWNYELGAKGSNASGTVQWDAALFWIDWRDQQISQTQPDGKGYILRNAGKSESKGVEAGLQVMPVKNLTLRGNYGFTHATFKKYEDELKNLSYNGKFLPMVPRHTVSLGAEYVFDIRSSVLERIVAGVQYTGLGKLYWKEDNVAYQSYYGLLDGRISLQKGIASLDLWMKNIGGTEYITYYFLTSKPYAQKGRPMMCGVNLNLRF